MLITCFAAKSNFELYDQKLINLGSVDCPEKETLLPINFIHDLYLNAFIILCDIIATLLKDSFQQAFIIKVISGFILFKFFS